VQLGIFASGVAVLSRNLVQLVLSDAPQVGDVRAMAVVLVVDDDRAARDVLCFTLEREGHAVTTAEDGLEAYKFARLLNPDLILLDMVLPTMDGPDVVALLRSNPNTQDVPIVAMSARYGFLSSMSLPVQGFVPKPFDPLVLLTILEEVLRQGFAAC
jgi:CheY-like chemotaxis protein